MGEADGARLVKILQAEGLDNLPGKFWHEAQLVLWPSDEPQVSEDLTLLNMERVTALVSNYKEKGFVYQLATYLREWQQEGQQDPFAPASLSTTEKPDSKMLSAPSKQ
ncbi:unnamed protein product [Cladocopium goreaui]|uniref:Uncharacterized protein n=1 Tax=Cladocopium goreaui TaxID=2562237 RepID=A0A9P1C2X6_9DINO|nr:unnamed protein product [Cladocopium goreaui]